MRSDKRNPLIRILSAGFFAAVLFVTSFSVTPDADGTNIKLQFAAADAAGATDESDVDKAKKRREAKRKKRISKRKKAKRRQARKQCRSEIDMTDEKERRKAIKECVAEKMKS